MFDNCWAPLTSPHLPYGVTFSDKGTRSYLRYDLCVFLPTPVNAIQASSLIVWGFCALVPRRLRFADVEIGWTR